MVKQQAVSAFMALFWMGTGFLTALQALARADVVLWLATLACLGYGASCAADVLGGADAD